MSSANLLPLPVLLPLLGAALTLVARRHRRTQVAISLGVLAASLAVAVTLMYRTHEEGPIALWLGAWSEPLGIALVADRLSALMLLVSSFVILVVLVFAIGQGVADGDDDSPLAIYFPTYLVLSAGVSNAFLAGDLFNLFVSFEMLLFASFVLLTLGGSGTRIRAGTTYVIVSMVSSFLFLAAIAATYAAAGTVNLAQLSLRLPDIDPTVSLALQLMLLTVFGIKAAVFPMSAWLPDSYPSAPVPVSAVFAGLLTKVGVYAIVRTQFLLFPDSPLHHLIMIAGLLTMLVGILGAVAQNEIKRMLSFTLVSHIGFMLLGIALATQEGLAATIYYTSHHITIQTALFLVVALVGRMAGSTSLDRIGGLVTVSPLLAALFSAVGIVGGWRVPCRAWYVRSWPGCSAAIPSCPTISICDRCGFAAVNSSRPSLTSAEGRMAVSIRSARDSSRAATARSAGSLRSRATERLLRLLFRKLAESPASRFPAVLRHVGQAHDRLRGRPQWRRLGLDCYCRHHHRFLRRILGDVARLARSLLGTRFALGQGSR